MGVRISMELTNLVNLSIFPNSPNNACVGGVLTLYSICWLMCRGLVGAGRLVPGCGWRIWAPGAVAVAGSCGRRAPAVAVAEALWCRCGVPWLWLECGFLYSLGSCRACLHNALCQCLHDMHRCTCALLCLHGCLHALLHCRHMMTHRIDYALMACSIVSTDCIIDCALL